MFLAQYLPLSVLADFTDGLVDNRRPQEAGLESQDAAFPVGRRVASHWAQHNVILERLHFQRLSGFELQLVANWLGNDETSSPINTKSGIHNGVVPW